MLKLKVTYPDKFQELEILRRMAKNNLDLGVSSVMSPTDIRKLRALVDDVYMDPAIEEYIVNLVHASRQPENWNLPIKELIEYGASPRATIYLTLTSKAHAILQGRGYVTPFDVKSMAMDVLRHRIIISYEAEAEGKSSEDLIARILENVEVP
jgi:MoxR-like ATPase